MGKSVIIIGAGIAGISCAKNLINNGFKGNITIIEAGNNYPNRDCTVDKKGFCANCKPCNTISGFGGSVHYGDTVKLSSFPSGKRLVELLGSSQSKDFQKVALSYFSETSLDFMTPSIKTSYLLKKIYPICILHSKTVQEVFEKWYDFLKSRINILFESEVTKISKTGNLFNIVFKNKTNEVEQSLKADFLVIGTGRTGFQKLSHIMEDMNIEFNQPKIAIGFRFIMPNYILQEIANLHPDFKTSMEYNNYKFKTFCFSAGKLGGRIKHANHGDFMLIDGHSITKVNEASEFSNFAILSQLVNDEGNYCSFAWIKDNIIHNYIGLNKNFPGKPVLQSYIDFKNKLVTNLSEQHLSRYKTKIYATGNLSSLISPEQHLGFCHSLEIVMKEFCRISNIKEPILTILNEISVLGLELESVWNEISLKSDMETSIPSLYMIGDCAGIAQGILQASTGGVAAAYSILKKN